MVCRVQHPSSWRVFFTQCGVNWGNQHTRQCLLWCDNVGQKKFPTGPNGDQKESHQMDTTHSDINDGRIAQNINLRRPIFVCLFTNDPVVQPCSREVSRPACKFPALLQGRSPVAPRSVAYCHGCLPMCIFSRSKIQYNEKKKKDNNKQKGSRYFWNRV